MKVKKVCVSCLSFCISFAALFVAQAAWSLGCYDPGEAWSADAKVSKDQSSWSDESVYVATGQTVYFRAVRDTQLGPVEEMDTKDDAPMPPDQKDDLTYSWDLAGGQNANFSDNNRNANCIYNTGGNRTVTLTVTDVGAPNYCDEGPKTDEVQVKVIDDLTVFPREAYVAVNKSKAFSAYVVQDNDAVDVTASSTFSSSRGSCTNSTFNAPSTPSASEGADWVRATYQEETTDSAHDSDVTVFDVEISTPAAFPVYLRLNEQVQLNSTVNPAGIAGDYMWTQVSGPAGKGSFSDSTIKNPTFSSGTPGIYKVKVDYTKDGSTASDTSGNIVVFDFEIIKPQDAQEFELTQANYTETPNVIFQARVLPVGVGGTIDWILDLSWDASPARSVFTKHKEFASGSGAEHTEKFTAEGGKLEIKASATVGGVTSDQKTITTYVIGRKAGIPNDTIIARVKELYDPDSELSQSEKDKLADVNWTDGICWGIIVKESSTMQFYNQVVENYPVVRMPYVSDDNLNGKIGDDNDGSHVGLMQVETSKATAWNWLTNTADGVDLYESKLHIALNHWQNEKNTYPDATKWTAVQLEDNTSGHYRYGSSKGWYLNWDDDQKEWKVTSDADLKAYVEDVRANAAP